MTDQARDRIDGTITDAQQRGEDAFSDLTGDAQISDLADVPQDQLGDFAEDAQSRAGDIAGDARTQAEGLADDGGGGLDDLFNNAKEALGGLVDKFTGGDEKQ